MIEERILPIIKGYNKNTQAADIAKQGGALSRIFDGDENLHSAIYKDGEIYDKDEMLERLNTCKYDLTDMVTVGALCVILGFTVRGLIKQLRNKSMIEPEDAAKFNQLASDIMDTLEK
jgi:hypothetical protein